MESRIAEQARRRGGRLPDRVANAPDIDEGLLLYWVAYCELSTCRPSGFSDGSPIPWTAINQYSVYHEFDEEQDEMLHYFVGKLDLAYAKWCKREAKKQRGH